MADNIQVKDAAGASRTLRTTDASGVHTPHHNAQLQIGGADVGLANRVPVSDTDMLEVSGSVSSAAVLFSQDTKGYVSVAVQVTSAGTSCTITYEASNDNTSWYAVAGYTPLNTGSTAHVTTSTTAILLVFPCVAKYFRARVSTYGSGTVAAQAAFRKSPVDRMGVNVANASLAVALSSTVAPAASATGAMTKARVQSAASTNATSVKASAGRLYEIHLCNTSAALKFVKFYNKASAPTVGTDTPVATYPIAANGGRVEVVSINGISFATGLAYAITGAVADADTTAVAANDVVGELLYS